MNENKSTEASNRAVLDRRRLEEAHLKFCLLDVFKRYPDYFPTWCIHTNFQECLHHYTPIYYDAFIRLYAG